MMFKNLWNRLIFDSFKIWPIMSILDIFSRKVILKGIGGGSRLEKTHFLF